MRGKMQHVTFDIDLVDEDFLTDGTMFDGSSIAGWKAINESDMKLRPDLDTADHRSLLPADHAGLFCDVVNPDTDTPYNRDPRSIAKTALNYVKSAGVGDTVFFGPEAEFFVFDDVRWNTAPHDTGYSYDSIELPVNTAKDYPEGNMGHRPGPKGGYFPVNPIDSAQDLRGEMLAVMGELGMQPEKHHHEVAPAQHELGLKFSDLITMADRMQLYKYVIHNVAAAYGKTATFMAKPMFGDNGSGMHVHQSIWKDGKPLFAGDKYAGLSQMCLWYIGGIIKHAKAINAFSNSTTNSYKRLVPGYEAPVKLAYSARNRSASIRIPHVDLPQGQAHRGPLPRPDGQPLPDLRGPADGRPRRHREQDRSGRPGHGQEPLRPAAARAEEGPRGLRLAARGAREPRQGPRLPQEGRRHGRRLHRRLHRAEDGRSHAPATPPAPGGIRHVLQVLIVKF